MRIAYTGPIRCGDTYHGVTGFVWNLDPEGRVWMYVVSSNAPKFDEPPTLVPTTEAKLRRVGLDKPNEVGTVIFPALCAKSRNVSCVVIRRQI